MSGGGGGNLPLGILLGPLKKFLAVKSGSLRGVLGIGILVLGGASILLKEGVGVSIAPYLHHPELVPGPRVKQGRSDKGEVNPKVSVSRGAVHADVDAIGDTSPSRVLGVAVKTGLQRQTEWASPLK